MSRVLAYGVGLGLTLLVAAPALQRDWRDSYPFSTYPMFTARRENVTLYGAAGIRAGRVVVLPPSLVAHGPEVMLAAVLVRRSVEAGPAAANAFCLSLAARAASAPAWRDLERIELTAIDTDPVEYFLDAHHRASRRKVVATCSLGSGPP